MNVLDNALYRANDFAYGTVLTAPSPATTGTSLVLNSGQGALFPSPATDGSFRCFIWPAGLAPTSTNCEEVEVTAISTDTFTITRHVGGVVRTVVVGDQVAINFGMSYYNKILRAIVDGVFEDVLLPGASFTRSSTTQFISPGDKTAFYTAGRILRVYSGSAYTVHTVVSSSYGSPNTTVIVTGTNLPATISNVYLAIAPIGRTSISDLIETLTNKTLTSPNINEAVALTATATELNNLHSQMGAWATWSPTIGNFTLGNGTIYANYIQIGKLVIARLKVVLGSTSAVTGSLYFSMPVSMKAETGTAGVQSIGNAIFHDNSWGDYRGLAIPASQTNCSLYPFSVSGSYLTNVAASSTVPMTWAVNDEVGCYIIYEAA